MSANTLDAMKTSQKKSKRKYKSIRRMISDVRTNDPAIFAYAAVNALTTGFEPVLSVFALQIIIGRMTDAQAAAGSVLVAIAVYIGLSTMLKIISVMSESRSWGRFAYLRMEIVREMFNKLLTMDYANYENASFFDERQSAFDAVSNNVSGIEGIYHKLFELCGKVISILFLAVVISLFNPLIVLVLVLSVIVSVFVLKRVSLFRHIMKPELNKAQRRVSRLSETSSNFAYGKDIRLFDLRGRVSAVFRREIAFYKGVFNRIANREFSLSLFTALASVIAELIMYALLVSGVISGSLSVAKFSMYLVAVSLLNVKLREAATDIGFIRDQLLYVDDMYKFLDTSLITENSDKSFSADEPIRIEFENVSFKYPGTERYVLRNLNLTIEPSEKLALVGINGSGKTTLVKLLCGLYRPTEGRILINGTDYMDMKLSDLQKLITMVSQDVQPLAFSVVENIAASETVDRDRTEQCLRQVGLWDKVKDLPKGMDTTVLKVLDEDGVVFSGGENQKLMIARALYKSGTQLMIMDEPTASLDALAEEKIYKEMNEIMQGKTSIFISHRIASTRFCDRIVLLDGGSIRQSGTHEELMAEGGLYREMFETQAKYYRDGNGVAV
jgi:ABC-type multidrug transport system fused ATPase/permease subunit